MSAAKENVMHNKKRRSDRRHVVNLDVCEVTAIIQYVHDHRVIVTDEVVSYT